MSAIERLYCSACDLETTEGEFKLHFKTEWHLYNIKRKVLQIPPITLELFEQRFTKEFQNKREVFSKATKELHKCRECNKTFSSDQTYNLHIKSKKHNDRIKESIQNPQENDKKEKKVIRTALDDPKICLYCDRECVDVEKCLEHMSRTHGFFIRSQDCLVDLNGLLLALAEQINKNSTCLTCFASFKDAMAVKSHMIDKGHCFMPQQEYKLLSKYYNFQEKLQAMIDEQMALLNIRTKEILPKEEKLCLEDEQNWEDDDQKDEDQNDEDYEDEDELEEEEDIKKVQKGDDEAKRNILKGLLKKLKQFKATETRTGELLLPNGKILGNRLLRKYYRQNHIPFNVDFNQKMLRYNEHNKNAEENQIVVSELYNKYMNEFLYKADNKKMIRQLNVDLRENRISRKYYRASC